MADLMLERESATAAVAQLLAAVRGGRPAVLAIVGPAGLGKTTLLRHALGAASDVASGAVTCSEVEGSIPFGTFDRLAARSGIVIPKAPARAGRNAVDARVARYSALLDWLEGRGAAPLLLAVDDLHWSDHDSVDLLSLLCRRLEQHPVAVLVTLRPWPSSALEQLQLLAHEGMASLHHLAPLSEVASADLLAARLGHRPEQGQLAAALAAAAGNPLLLTECAAALGRGEDLVATSTETVAARVFLPRFAGVGPEALRWARAASVLGTRFEPAVAMELSGQDGREAAESLERLCTAGLLRNAGGGPTGGEPGAPTGRALAEFAHPLVRQALYDDLPEPVRQGLHAAAFSLLRARGAAAEALPHALAGGVRGDGEAAALLVEAGLASLAAGAVATAAAHLEQAVELTGSAASSSLLLRLAEAELALGRVAQAETVVRRVLSRETSPDSERIVALRMLAQLQLASAQIADSKRSAAAASALAASADPDLAADILLDSAFVGWLFEGVREARRSVVTALELIGGSSGPMYEAARAAEGYLAVIAGEFSGYPPVAAAAREALACRDGLIRTPWRWDVLFGYTNLAKITEHFADSERVFDGLIRAAESQGAAVSLQALAVNHADTLVRLGRLHEARAMLERASQLSGLVPGVAPFASIGLSHVSSELGDMESSLRHAEHVQAVMAASIDLPYLRLWLHQLTCRRSLQAGRVGEAAQAGEASRRLALESGIVEPCVVPWHQSALEALVAADRLDDAEELAEWLSSACAPLPCRAPRSVAAAGRALVAWRRGDVARADGSYEEALAELDGSPMPLALAEVLVAYGRFCRLNGRAAAARDLQRRALAVLEPTGAERLAGMARHELSLAGGRRSAGGRSGALTAQEQRVVELAAEGLTSAQIAAVLFLSRKTVDHHLGRSYAKLGISSRRELIRRGAPNS